ncbi:MAG: hypothetical protein FD143_3698 [Ignavibacteria bacterium]|nr:MAG: hypothetical protein FD143_3698 [Ignavibacteria bacterium]
MRSSIFHPLFVHLSSTSTTSSGSKYCDLPPPSAARCNFQFGTYFFSSTHTCAERNFFCVCKTPLGPRYNDYHSACSIIEGLPVFPEHFSKDIGKTYKACRSICITIKHPGVTVARLTEYYVRRCGFDSRWGIGKTYKACKSICITIKHPGVTVARLTDSYVRRCGFDSRWGQIINFFSFSNSPTL